uniref:isoleucine--tRNA ligase n=2 Tax=Rhizochromulina marina TaxID=1034831 RepID=A0A7S2WSX5_9STRA
MAAEDDVVAKLLAELPANLSFPEEEERVLAFWAEIDAFKTQLELTRGKPEYTFYDGPPFATGLPHYGHILAGTIKDTVTRYASQTGHFVERRFGWDCHGLPVEFEIDKTLGITNRDQVFEMGIDKYNAECRSIVSRYTKEWESTVKRLGRWIDFENDYKTMNPWFMESVWWVFKQLFAKGLVYQGYKVMPYSTACGTPLSNFEAGLNYKEVEDPAVVVSFPLEEDPSVSLLAWTTTPWTLPSNLALCVNVEFDYVKIQDVKTERLYILLETRLVQLYPVMGGKKWKPEKNSTLFTVLEKIKGKDLVGKRYTPLFRYFVDSFGESAFRVIEDGYVTADGGTGIVHQAPAFGEDDYRVCLKHGVIAKGVQLPCPVDFNGCYTAEVSDFEGQHVKQADAAICDMLKAQGRLVASAKYLHSYPFCWRSDTPLIYKAVPSWFVAVEQFKDRLLKNNEQTYWVPNFVKEGRFHNWLKEARDWAISRNRFWGTPIPIWASEDMQELIAIGSVAELEELAGLPKGSVTDLHRESIDDIVIPSKQGKGNLRRVDEVFDCWFESGSMPYAQLHYPFENKERFEKGFPAHFIAEGLDQTRGWFYTLMVLSTALFDRPAFSNLIVNGMVLAADGKKMSKRLKNYPDPNAVIATYGADALRMYLINSPVVRAEPLKFTEPGVKGVARDVILPWYNTFRFFLQNAHRWQLATGKTFRPDAALASSSANPINVWIRAELQSLIAFVHEEMSKYRLYTVMPRLVSFLEQLSKWYLRLNRDRLRGADGEEEALVGLSVLYFVVISVASIMSPFTPFFSEFLYQKLRQLHPDFAKPDKEAMGSAQSVHFLTLPRPEAVDPGLNARVAEEMAALQTVIELGRKAKEAQNISHKKPVKEVIIVTCNPVHAAGLHKLQNYLESELSALKITVTDKEDQWCSYKAIPNFKELGKRCGKQMQQVKKAIVELSNSDMATFRATGELKVLDFDLGRTDLAVTRHFAGDKAKFAHMESEDGSMVIAIDTEEDAGIIRSWVSRELVSTVQKLRKVALLEVGDKIEVFFREIGDTQIAAALEDPAIATAVEQKLGCRPLPKNWVASWTRVLASSTTTVRGGELEVLIALPSLVLAEENLRALSPETNPDSVGQLLGSLPPESPQDLETSVTVFLDGKTLALVRGEHYFLSAQEMILAAKRP